MNDRIKELRKTLKLTQQGFADRLGVKRNTVAQWEIGINNLSEQITKSICREFNVSETWLRTGEGEMFIPSPNGALEALAREYELSPGMYVLIKRLLALKPENQQAVVDFAVKLVEDLNGPSPALDTTRQELTQPDTGEQEQTEVDTGGQKQPPVDIAAELAELKRQNRELAAKVAAMEEEDARREASDELSTSGPSGGGTKLA